MPLLKPDPLLTFHENTCGFRDPLLGAILQIVAPNTIVEVGGWRDMSKFSRYSDGWATLTFLAYLKRKGGAVYPRPVYAVADRDPEVIHLMRTNSTVQKFQDDLQLEFFNDGIHAIIESQINEDRPVLVYLDGANDEFGMKDQFCWCDINEKTSVLCDDVGIKGAGLHKHLSSRNIPFIPIPIQFKDTATDWRGNHLMLFVPSVDLLARSSLTSIGHALTQCFDVTINSQERL